MAKVKIQGHASGTGVLTVTAPNTSTDRTITLPDSTGTLLDENSSVPAANLTGTVATARLGTGTGGTGNFLRGDGSWQAAGSTSATDLTSGTLNRLRLPAGSVIQVVQTVFTGLSSQTNVNAQTNDSGGYGSAGLNWTDLDTTLTPSATSSKILVMINAQFSTSHAVYGVYRLQRGINGATPSLSSSSGWMPPTSGSGTHWLSGAMFASTNPGTTGGWGGNGLPPYAWQYLDSPNTTDAVKYRVNTYIKSDISGAGLIYLNRTYYGGNDYGTNRAVSTVTLMEIAG